MSVKQKTLILIRHAHRDKDHGRGADNGLSEKGKKQAQQILKYFEKRFPKGKPLLFSSPKQRCIETIEAISRQRKSKLHIETLLDEGYDLDYRVGQFVRWWKGRKNTRPVVVCSHGDWIPLCISRLTSVEVDIQKGGWAELVDVPGEGIKLAWLIQEF